MSHPNHKSSPSRPMTSGSRIHWVYFLLAGFDLLTVGLSLLLIAQIMGIYTHSMAENQRWANRLSNFSELTLLAAAVNAPGNDFFTSRDINAETTRLDKALDNFNQKTSAVRKDLLRNVNEDQAVTLLASFEDIDLAMTRMVTETRNIFAFFDHGQIEKAGEQMTAMDRTYGKIIVQLIELGQHVRNIQTAHFDQQRQQAASLRKYEFLIAGLILVMVIGIALYGRRLAKRIALADEKIRQLNETLEQRVHECVAQLETTNEGLQTEIGERRQAEQESHERNERLQAILSTVADAIIIINQQGIITCVNPATEQIFGYTEKELVDENIKILMPPPYCDEHDGYLARYLDTGKSWVVGQRRELPGRCKDGSILPLELAVTEIDHLGLYCGIIRDLSEKKMLEREVADISTLEQQRIGQEIHDGLGQELTALNLFATKLKRDLDKLNLPQANTAQAMIDLLQQAMFETRTLSHGLVPVPVTPEGLSAALRKLAQDTQASTNISCHFESNSPVTALDQTTAMQLYRIVQEALNNAIKYAEATQIIIQLEQVEDSSTLTISDDGKGFDLNEKIKAGYGLRIMHYRAGIVGCHLQIQTQAGKGTLIACRFTPDRITPH